MQKKRRFWQPTRIVVTLSGALSAALGVAVLSGWHSEDFSFILAVSDSPPMVYNSAVGFTVCGLGLLTLAQGWLRCAQICGAVVAGLGFITLGEDWLDANFAIDQLLLGDFLTSATNPHPGRMPLISAVCFALSGIALLLVNKRLWRGVRSHSSSSRIFPLVGTPASGRFKIGLLGLLGASIASLGLVTALFYLTGMAAPYGWGRIATMPAHSALGFIGLGIGILAMAWRESRTLHAGAPRWLPFLVSAGVVAATLLLWQGLLVEEHRQIRRTVLSVTNSMQNELTARMDARILALLRVAQRWEYTQLPSQEQWELEAELTLRYFPGYRVIAWIDIPAHIRWVVARDKGQNYDNLQLVFEEAQRQTPPIAKTGATKIVTKLLDLPPNEKGLAVLVPIFPDRDFGGFVVGIFSLQDLFDSALKNIAPGYNLVLLDQQEEIYRRTLTGSRQQTEWQQELALEPYGVSWRIQVWPQQETLARERSTLSLQVLGTGLLLACLLGWMIALAQTAQQRAREVTTASLGLNLEINTRKQAEEALREAQRDLELRVEARTIELANANTQLHGEIIERKRAQEQLLRQAQELTRSNRELEQFAQVASHDLQEPLRKIVAFGDLLRRLLNQTLSEEAQEYLTRMQAAATRMQTLIHDLLTLSRVTTQSQPFMPVDLSAVARTVVSDLEVALHQVGGHVVIGDLPTIDADATQMRQLLQNLIGNAVKFHKAGESPVVEIRGACQNHTPSEGNGAPHPSSCWLTIHDNGIGFDERYLDRIFKPFQRLHGRGAYDGTGMGLAICRKIIDRHGGDITATSTPGQGTTFIVTLPMQQSQEGEKA